MRQKPTSIPILCAAAWTACLLTAAGAASAQPPSAVPTDMQGVWGRHGRCDVAADRLTVTAHTAGWGNGKAGRVYYDATMDAVMWQQEGVVDNFVRSSTPAILIHNTQGFDMPGEDGYARCGRNLARVPWPVPDASPQHTRRK